MSLKRFLKRHKKLVVFIVGIYLLFVCTIASMFFQARKNFLENFSSAREEFNKRFEEKGERFDRKFGEAVEKLSGGANQNKDLGQGARNVMPKKRKPAEPSKFSKEFKKEKEEFRRTTKAFDEDFNKIREEFLKAGEIDREKSKKEWIERRREFSKNSFPRASAKFWGEEPEPKPEDP